MAERVARVLTNHLPYVLRRRRVTWGELGRRTLLPARLLRRLREPRANPSLAVAERIATALGVPIEALWTLGARRR